MQSAEPNAAWRGAAASKRWNIRPFINGAYCDSRAAGSYEHLAPATESRLCSYSVGDESDIDEAVRVARLRFAEGSWRNLPPGRRASILVRLAELIVEHKAEFALLDSLEMGKPITAALYDAGSFAPSLLRSWAGLTDKLTGVSAPLSAHRMEFNFYEPRGVVGAISPWNFPIVNAVYKLGPALAAGNALVLKPSEITPSSALRLAELAVEAGVPPGVFNVVPGLGSTVGAALASHMDVDMVSFTGSTGTGRKIMQLCGSSNGKPLLLECGGKSPQIVCEDVNDLESIASAAVQAAFHNQGQVCAARTRLIASAEIKPTLLRHVLEKAKEYRVGDPLDETTTFGSLASRAQRARVSRFIEEGIQMGADAVLKGAIQMHGGCFVSPTVFDNVQLSMPIVQQEIFGPVLCVEAFQTEEQAIDLANATQYGLSVTIWTRDSARGRRMARAIRAGSVVVKTSTVAEDDPPLILSREPQKASGFGSELGLRGLESYSSLKLVTFEGN